MNIKGIAKLLLTTAFVLLCVSAVSADNSHPDSEYEIPENSTQIDVSIDETCFDEYEKYTEKVMLSMKDEGYSSSADYEITSIYPLYEIYSYDEPYSLMYDIKCSDGTYYSMLVNCERNVVSVSRKRQSLHSRYVEENGINPDNIRFIHELFGAYYLDVETGIFYDCETGEVAVPLTPEEIEKQKAEREKDRMDNIARSSTERTVITEKQKQKLKEKAEYERHKAEEQKLNTAPDTDSVTGISSYPDYSMISDVPYNRQTTACKCIPTSILNVMAYWDENGYDGLFPSLSRARTEIVDAMCAAFNNTGDQTENRCIPYAVETYADSKGYYGNAVNMFLSAGYDFFDLQYEIVHGYPCLAGFPRGGPFREAHMTVGVGYEIGSDGTEYVYVNDNHGNHEDKYEFSELDFISGIEILDV